MEVLAMASACSQYLLERLNEVLIMKCCSNPVSNRTPMKSFRLQKLNDNLVQKLNTALLSANAVADDAEEKEYQNPTVKVWLNELKDAVYRADDLLDEIFTEDLQNSLDAESQTKKSQICKPQSFHKRKGNRTKHINRTMEDTLHRLKDIVKNIDSIGLKERVYDMKLSPRMSTSLVKKDQVFGRNGETEEIIDLLLRGCGRPGLSVIRIVGMGGIGKTALAQLVYNDYRVWEHFDLRAWVCISEYTDTFRATKVILESITSECCYLNNLDSLQVRLREVLMHRRFLLVLDDMWNDEYNDWEVLQAPFNDATPGSCVIITTRSHRVPAMKSTVYTHVYTHTMRPLSEEDSWNLFVTSAFGYEEPRPCKLEEIGREIARKCGGLPLAVKKIGNILGSKQILNEWQDCLQRLSFPSEEMHDVFSNIKLSYDALPAYLKRCFAYCSIFPKGYVFVKEKLVLLWMAEGLLQLPGENRRMEEVGDKCFRELVWRSFFFQTSENTSKYVMPDLWNNTSRFVMHDLLNDLAVSVAGEYCFTSKEFSHISARTRHLSVSNCSTSVILEGVRNVKFLRSFLLLDHISCHLSSNELQTLSKLQFLRVLSLSHYPIIKLPDSICNLIHLRYVDLSHSELNMLPESVCALCNLQTLILSNCQYLTELPKNTWKLINLRHLDINGTNLHEMPKKMSRLGNLGTLPYFVVNEESGSTVKELGGLLYLHGALRISKLQNVVSPDDAAEAGLANKRYLDELVLEWGDDTVDPHHASTMLEQLMPHTNLKGLSINFYSGISFPNWLGDFSFSNMVFLHLRECKNCLELPPLGQLPSLKVLIIEGMTAVMRVGPEFYGRDMPLKSFESPKLKDIPFKSLETLTFDNMLEWREWTSFEGGEFPKFEGREFPCLQKLRIWRCPMLKGILPKQPRSLEIEIFECEFLSRHTSEVKLHKKPSHSLSMTQGNIGAVKFSLPLTEVVTESSLPLTQGAAKSSLPLTEGATESSLPLTQSATESTLPMTQGKVAKTLKETSETEGKGESEEGIDKGSTTSETKETKHKEKESIEEYLCSSLFSDEDSPLPSTQGAIESPLLPLTEGATESSLTMAEGTVDNSLPIAECIIDSSLTMTQGSVAKTLKETTKMEGRVQTEEIISLEIATTSESKWTKQEQKVSMEEDPSCCLYSDEKSSLPLTQGATESSFPMAEGAVHTSLPMAEGVVDTSLPMTQGKVAKTLKESLETEGRGKAEEEIGLEIAIASKTKGTKQEQKEFIEEDPFPSLLSDEESLLPTTQGATKSSLPMAESVVDTSLPTTQDQNSTFPSTQGATESSLSMVEGVVETSLPMTQGKVAMTLKEILERQGKEEADEEIGLEISTTSETKLTKQEEKEFIEEDPYPSFLLSDENSSLPMAQSVVDTPLPMTQGKVSKTLKETLKAVGRGESEEETSLEKETTSETEGIKHEQKEFIEKDPSYSVFSDEKSSLPSTQGAVESLLPPLTQGAIDALLPKTQGQAAKTLKETSEREGRGEKDEEIGLEKTSETKGTKHEQKESHKEDPSLSLFSAEKALLPLNQGGRESSLALAQGVVDTSLPMTQDEKSHLPLTQGGTESSLPLAEGVVDTSLPMTQDEKSHLPLTQGGTECSLPVAEGVVDTSLPMTQDKKSHLPLTQGGTESSLPMAEGVVDTSLSMTQEEKSHLPLTQGGTESSLPMAGGVVDTSLPMTQDEKSHLPLTQGRTESSLPLAGGVVDTSLPMTQDEKSHLPLTQGGTESSLPLAEGVVDTSLPMTQDEKSHLPLTHGGTESSLPVAEGVVDTSLPMTQDEKSHWPLTQGSTESSLPMAEGVVDTSLSMTQDEKSHLPLTQGGTESSLPMAQGIVDTSLPMTQGHMRSTSLIKKLKESTETDVDIETTFDAKGIKLETEESKKEDPSLFSEDQSSLHTTQEPRESLFLRSQTPNGRDEADVWTNSRSSQDGVHDLSSFESMKVSGISELKKLPRQVHSLTIEGCDDLKFIPEEVDLEPPLKHLYIINCCSLESFSKDHPPTALKILYVRNCKKLDFPLTKEKTQQDALLEYLCIGSSCDSLKLISLDLFPRLKSLSIWDCENLKSLSMPEGIPKNLAFLEALEIRDCPNLDTFPKGGLPTPNLKSIWLSNCNNLKQLPDQLQTLDSLQSMFLNNCPELESLSKKDFPSSLSLLSITFCNKLRLGTEWGLNELQYLSRLEIEGISVNAESFPEENLLPNYLSSLRISGLLNLKDLNGKGLQHLTTLKTLEISCCDKLRSLPEDGFPSSLSFLCIKECSLLTLKFRNKRGKDWSKIAHISCIEIDEEVIS